MKPAVRAQTTDQGGTPLTPGTKVRLTRDGAPVEGTVVRVLDDYGVVTVLLPEGRGQVERMLPTAEVQVI